MKITILAVGETKSDSAKELVKKYSKMLRPYFSVTVEFVKAEAFSESSKKTAQQKDEDRIIKRLEKFDSGEIVILTESGKQYTSQTFATHINRFQSRIVFVIGGSLGFTPTLLKAYPQHVSLSGLTFPHELALVILMEQLYRTATILRKKTYHY